MCPWSDVIDCVSTEWPWVTGLTFIRERQNKMVSGHRESKSSLFSKWTWVSRKNVLLPCYWRKSFKYSDKIYAFIFHSDNRKM